MPRGARLVHEIEKLSACASEMVAAQVGPESPHHSFEVEAVGEVAGGTVDDDRANIVVFVEGAEDFGALFPEIGPKGVSFSGAEKGNFGDMVANRDAKSGALVHGAKVSRG